MTLLYSHKDYERDPFLATAEIGRMLASGSLRLFLGAGVSAAFGLPEWKLLVARLLERESDASFMADLASRSSSELGRLLDPLDDGSTDYYRRVHEALYRDVAADLLEQLQRSPLLLAVAALMTGSHRGRVESVVTYNYDDILERYLRMLGYAVQRRTRPDMLSRRADVVMNHVHGSLPQEWQDPVDTSEIVLSEKSFRGRRAAIDEGWSADVENGMYSRAALFLGMSGDDSTVLDILKRAQKRLKRTYDYTGYWVLTPAAFKRNKDAILEVGVCPIEVQREQIPNFILGVCQHAAV